MKEDVINKCPCCNSPLQENARFCLYCMTSLDEKSAHEPVKIRNRRLIWIICTIVIACAVSVAIIIACKSCSAKTPVDKSNNLDTTTDKGTLEDSPAMPLVSYDDFYWGCVLYTQDVGLGSLWDPMTFFCAETTDMADRYVVKDYMGDVSVEAYFVDGGTSILTSITNIPEEGFSDARKIANCMSCAIYGSDDMNIPESDLFPGEEITPESLSIYTTGILDFVTLQGESGRAFREKIAYYNSFDPSGDYYMLYELCEKKIDGEVFYDIYLYHTQGQ